MTSRIKSINTSLEQIDLVVPFKAPLVPKGPLTPRPQSLLSPLFLNSKFLTLPLFIKKRCKRECGKINLILKWQPF